MKISQFLICSTLKKFGSWIKIKNNSDNYKGYIRNKNFPKDQKNSHKIFSLSSNLYSRPNKKYKISFTKNSKPYFS